jgi:hypothetical protein
LPLDDSSETFPYYFVADETIPLTIILMRPYHIRMLSKKEAVYVIADALMPVKA